MDNCHFVSLFSSVRTAPHRSLSCDLLGYNQIKEEPTKWWEDNLHFMVFMVFEAEQIPKWYSLLKQSLTSGIDSDNRIDTRKLFLI